MAFLKLKVLYRSLLFDGFDFVRFELDEPLLLVLRLFDWFIRFEFIFAGTVLCLNVRIPELFGWL